MLAPLVFLAVPPVITIDLDRLGKVGRFRLGLEGLRQWFPLPFLLFLLPRLPFSCLPLVLSWLLRMLLSGVACSIPLLELLDFHLQSHKLIVTLAFHSHESAFSLELVELLLGESHQLGD